MPRQQLNPLYSTQLETRPYNDTPRLSDEDILERVQRLQSAIPAQAEPPQAPPPVQSQPYVMAEQLEQQAQPPERATGWRGIGQSVMRGLASTGHPGGYHGYAQDQAAMERQRQQDLLGRAQQLRGEGLRRDQMNLEAGREQRLHETSTAQLGETRRLREIQEAAEARQASAPVIVPRGSAAVNRQTGQPIFTSPYEPTEKNPGFRDVERNGRVFRQYFDQSDPSKVTHEVDTGAIPPRGLQSEPGTYMDLRDDQGRVIGAWNPKSGEFKPVPPQGEGLRRTPLSATERQQLTGMEVMLQDISTLRGLADQNRHAIGPIQGRLAAAKRLTIGETDEVNELFRLSDNLADQLLRARSGAQINEAEYKRLRSLVPNPRLPEAKFFSDLDSFESELTRTLAGRRSPTIGAPTGNTNSTGGSNTGQPAQRRVVRFEDLP